MAVPAVTNAESAQPTEFGQLEARFVVVGEGVMLIGVSRCIGRTHPTVHRSRSPIGLHEPGQVVLVKHGHPTSHGDWAGEHDRVVHNWAIPVFDIGRCNMVIPGECALRILHDRSGFAALWCVDECVRKRFAVRIQERCREVAAVGQGKRPDATRLTAVVRYEFADFLGTSRASEPGFVEVKFEGFDGAEDGLGVHRMVLSIFGLMVKFGGNDGRILEVGWSGKKRRRKTFALVIDLFVWLLALGFVVLFWNLFVENA